MPRRIQALAPALVVAAVVSACGSSSSGASSTSGGSSAPAKSASGPKAVTVKAEKVGSLGTVLVSSGGYALYVFAPDNAKKVTCNSDCQSIWPPEVAPASGDATAGPGVKQSLIGSLPNPATGGRIVTYDGWPLYTYVADHAPGQATGQNLDLNGGYWWVITPSGKLIK